MNLTSNFDFCVELGIAHVREIFHLAFKSEDRYPHNIGPLARTFSGRTVTLNVRVLDDETDAADLSFQDDKHVLFSFPFELTAEVPDAPDPALSRITMRVRVEVPALLDSWDEDGEAVLGLSFHDVTAADVAIVGAIEGLPSVNIDNIRAAIHSRYDAITHEYPLANNTLIFYDDARDVFLEPANEATPYDIEAVLETHGSQEYVKATAPIHVDVELPGGFGTYTSYGRVIFWRELVETGTTIEVRMGDEPADASLASQVELDNNHPARGQVIASLTPLLVAQLGNFGTIVEPSFSQSEAQALLQNEIAAYLSPRRYPVFSPRSGDPSVPLSTPVGFLLVGDGVMAILMNRRDNSVADHAPDNFLGSHEFALAVGPEFVAEQIREVRDSEFPGLDNGGELIETEEGDATLEELNVTLADPGDHGETAGHLWVTGEAEVHIDCWPDPDVSFDGPVFIDATPGTTPEGECELTLEGRAGDFDFDQSCCDVLIDLVIPIVGWIMLAVVEGMIDKVGGAVATDIADAQAEKIEAFPPVINGIAEVKACLQDLNIFRDGFVFPGTLEIRRLGTSFEDREEDHDLPRP